MCSIQAVFHVPGFSSLSITIITIITTSIIAALISFDTIIMMIITSVFMITTTININIIRHLD